MPARQPLRLFLDTGVLIDGFFDPWGPCKGVLILATSRGQFRVVVAEPVAEEFRPNTEKKLARLSEDEVATVRASITGWFGRARPERAPWPLEADLLAHAGLITTVRHRSDMPAVVAALLARPDWVLSTNTDHWNEKLAAHTRLRIATPASFLRSLYPRPETT